MSSEQLINEQSTIAPEQIDLQHQAVVSELQKLLELLRVGRKDVDAWTDLIRLYVQALLRIQSSKGTFGRLIHIYYHCENLISDETRARRAARKAKGK